MIYENEYRVYYRNILHYNSWRDKYNMNRHINL